MSKRVEFLPSSLFPFVEYFHTYGDEPIDPDGISYSYEEGSAISNRIDEFTQNFTDECYQLENKYIDLFKVEFPQFVKFLPYRLGDCNEQTKN